MEIIPAVDVLNGQVVRLFQGSYDEVTTYSTDPIEVARSWTTDGATLIHVVDLTGARTGEPDVRLWGNLGRSGIEFQIGGGIRDPMLAIRALEAGASRVVVGTAAVTSDTLLGEIISVAGSEHVVAAIDVRGGLARGSGWTDKGAPLDDVVRRVVDSGVETAVVTGIERDGALNGPNVELLSKVRSIAPNLQVIASGGVSSLADITALADLACGGVIIGKALYEHRFTMPEAIGAAVL
jgi:phosphoribosylformimino-5-aminoimidazole carboxamide ribotide isomerase